VSSPTVAFHITDRCQLDCKHCLRDPARAAKDLPVALIRSVLGQTTQLYGKLQVALTGGEPTLHPEFAEILDAVVEHGLTWHMVSNGRRMERVFALFKERPARRAAATAMNFSLDGADEATHDAVRGAGSYRDVMRAAALCVVHDLPFSLQMALHRKNVHQIEALGMLASQLKAKRVSFAILQATGTPLDAELHLSAREWRDAMDRVVRLAEILKVEVKMPEGWYMEQPFHQCEVFGSLQLHVDVEGRLNLCCQHSGIPSEEHPAPDVLADLRTTPLAEAHARLLDLIHKLQRDKLARVAAGGLSEWEHFPCNDCMKTLGKPYWDEHGAVGPSASRERWRGAWAKKRLPLAGR
jgi:MoaA/NifB/PqqE/SkfB family radical SAM enzyme